MTPFGLSGAKQKAVRGIASASEEGKLDETNFLALDPAERRKQLLSMWGVGPWTVDMIESFFVGHPDIWPDGDVAACNALAALTSRRRKTVRTAEHFAPYRTYLALYMRRYVDTDPDAWP